MRDDPGKRLKWLEQELLAEDMVFQTFSGSPASEYVEDDDLLELVDMLLSEEEEPEEEMEEAVPVRNFANNYGRQTIGVRAEQARGRQQFDESSAVLTKTRKQLRQEAKRQKIAEKKAAVNRNITGLIFLAILECLGILAILGWWLQ